MTTNLLNIMTVDKPRTQLLFNSEAPASDRLFPSGSSRAVPLMTFLLVLLLTACTTTNPLEEYQKELAQYPEYQVILQDMKEEGNFTTDYMHQYKIVWAEPVGDSLVFNSEITDWHKVSKDVYQQHQQNLGMALVARSESAEPVGTAQPPGYQYVGNPRYGHWQTGLGGGSFWAFYGQYAFMSSMFNMISGPVQRNDFDNYRSTVGGGRSYYGLNNRYGTNGSQTKQTNKSFFERRTARASRAKARQRTGRSTMNRFRGRSSGRGGK